MIAYNCTECQDTGKRILPNGEHSNCLDCSCEATTERAAMDVAAMDYIQAYEGDLQHAPEDVRWFVHQRAVKMQAARIAELESRIEFNGDHSQDGIVKRDERIADLERQLRNAKFAENLDAENKAFFASLRAPSAPAVEQQPMANDGWLIDGSLVYKLDPTGTMNAFEINVTQAEGSRKSDGPRIELAKRILAWLTTSAPAVAQQISCAYCKKGTCYKHDDAPQAADADKVREVSAWEALRADVLHGVDGLDNDQVNTVLGMIDYYTPTASMAAQAPVREVPGWISVKDQLPGIGVDVVVYCGYMVTAQRTNDQHDPENHKGWVIDFDNGRATEITHWMPLPAAPVQQEGDRG